MRTILLIRHAPADYRNGTSCCLGSRTDVPATVAGLEKAKELAPLLKEAGVASVWHSPMLRCRQTAEALADGLPVAPLPGLEELDCGVWDGLSFDEIRARWPAHYARRGEDPALPPPGGEDPADAAARGLAALTALMQRTEGNLAVVAHAGIDRAMLCALQNLPMREMRGIPQTHLCVNILRYDGKRFTVAAAGLTAPTKEEIEHEKAL